MTQKKRRIIIARRAISILSRIAPGTSAKIAAKWFMTPEPIKAPGKESLFLATAAKRETIGGCAVWRWGKGPKVILMHGWSGRGAQMRAFVDPLVAAGFEVIAFDAPGHGQSGRGRSSLKKFAHAIQGIVAHEGKVHAVIGHSLGGAAAILAVSRGAAVEKLVLVGMPSDLTRVFDSFCNALGLSASARTKFYQECERVVGISAKEASPLFLGPRLGHPALILHDPLDEQVSVHHARELRRIWPETHLELIPGVGHYRILKSGQAIDLTTKFLVSSSPQR